jgi:hypothetical protein
MTNVLLQTFFFWGGGRGVLPCLITSYSGTGLLTVFFSHPFKCFELTSIPSFHNKSLSMAYHLTLSNIQLIKRR